MSRSVRVARGRRTIGLVLAVSLLLLAGCTSAPQDSRRSKIDAQSFVVSYRDTESLLHGQNAGDVTEQLRDWTKTALAAHLRLDTDQVRNAGYDSLPIRDSGFADLATQPTGPGRSLLDGAGVLHLLVPDGDPHQSRTIGLLLDQYRTDSGQDPTRAQVDHYRIETSSQQIRVTPDPIATVSSIRRANGYVTMPVGTSAQLTSFLQRTSTLSRLELHGTKVSAAGWNWPVNAGDRVDEADVSALQRGYLNAGADNPLPGFSLDPQPITTVADLRAVIPGLSANLASRVIHRHWSGSPLRSAANLRGAVGDELYYPESLSSSDRQGLKANGVPTDRAQLWALYNQLIGHGAYSQARYDGGLAGTAVGMTLFYTDYVAKNWTVGAGGGIPAGKVPGFVPDTQATTPWDECRTTSETGRLWFGQNDTAFRSSKTSISLGAQPTRLFSRSNSAAGEVEPSYAAGRGLSWWDQNYQAVADYEPQYQRLDDIMRWSGALDWLSSTGGARLPQLPDASIPHNLTFAHWYAKQSGLRSRSPIDFVKPPSARQEAVAHLPTVTRQDCGGRWIEGGVSLGDRSLRIGDNDYAAKLPRQVDRAGNLDPSSHFDAKSGSGEITEVSIGGDGKPSDHVERILSRTPAGHDVVQTVADGRTNEHFAGLKIWSRATASQELSVDLDAGRNGISEQLGLHGQGVGQLLATDTGLQVTLQWNAGPLERLTVALTSLQKRLSKRRSGPAPAPAEDVLYGVRSANGSTTYRLDDGSGGPESYLSVDPGTSTPTTDLAFRLGAPGPEPTRSRPNPVSVRWFEAKVTAQGPTPPPGDWIEVRPATGDEPIMLAAATHLGQHARTLHLAHPDGTSAGAIRFDPSGRVQISSSILDPGAAGSAEIVPLLAKLTATAAVARKSGDGLLRAVDLPGGTTVLVGDTTAILVPGGHAWAAQIAADEANGSSAGSQLFRVEGDQLFAASDAPLIADGAPRQVSLADLIRTGGGRVYENDAFRSTFTFHTGPSIHSNLPLETLVTVRAFHTRDNSAQAEVLAQDSTHWWLVGSGSSTSDPTATSTAGAPVRGASIPGASEMLLVCPQGSTPNAGGCQQ